MNIYSKLLLGAAVFSLAACSSEEPMGENQPEVIKPSGDVAYLTVRLQSADGSRSRAEGDYLYGDKAENAVENAFFYFYDENGNYVLQSNSWLGGNASSNPGDVTNGNIEFKGETTIVLTGLTGKSYPTWVVTVLNKPEGFEPASTLADMGKVLINSYSNGDIDSKNNETNFTMTTSSFFGGVNANMAVGNEDAKQDYTYFATKLKDTDFKEEGKENANATIVDIYVERLAARVGVRVDLEDNNKRLDNVFYTDKNGIQHALYELPISVAGETNPDLGEEENTAAATRVYVAIVGWELNSTAAKTNLMKDLTGWDINKDFDNTGWAWNNSDNHRSFWGKSFTYGKEKEALVADLKTNNYAWDELTKQVSEGRFIGDRVYCNETTNIPDNILKNGLVFSQYTPSVVLAAVVCNNEGNALELVRYQGVEFLKNSFINKILSITNKADNSKNFYTRTVVDTTTDGEEIYEYNQVGFDDVELVSAGNGLGSVKVAVKDNNIKYYTNLVVGEPYEGEYNKYTKYTYTEVDADAVNARLAEPTTAANKAIAKTDGAMFYTIPLTHLNMPTGTAVVEGQYGLVRNHVYDLSITKIKSLGDGVFKPNKEGDDFEPINPEDPKDPTFYVESAINILSWKIVSQSVEI